MATFKTDLYTAQSAESVRYSLPAANKVTAEVGWLDAIVTVTAAYAAADVIQIGQIPVGAAIIAEDIVVTTDGVGGTGATIAKIGDASDDDRYSATAIAIVSAGTTRATPANATALTPYKVTKDTNVITAAVGLSSGSLTAGKKVRFRVPFTLP